MTYSQTLYSTLTAMPIPFFFLLTHRGLSLRKICEREGNRGYREREREGRETREIKTGWEREGKKRRREK